MVLLLIGFMIVFWFLANMFSKPVLNRMHNYYEDDKDGRSIANIFIGMMLMIAFILGYIVS